MTLPLVETFSGDGVEVQVLVRQWLLSHRDEGDSVSSHAEISRDGVKMTVTITKKETREINGQT
jgi:hypothetical protein